MASPIPLAHDFCFVIRGNPSLYRLLIVQLKLELHNCKLELAAALERSNEVMEVKDQVT
jgi:hypothetical protein